MKLLQDADGKQYELMVAIIIINIPQSLDKLVAYKSKKNTFVINICV